MSVAAVANGAVPGASRAARRAIVLLLVTALSLSVLLFVGFAEASRTYGRFQIERLRAETEVVRTALDPLLQSGLPLRQIGGFANLAERLQRADPAVVAVALFDASGRPVMQNGREKPGLLAEGFDRELRRDGRLVQIALELRSRFETLGTLAVSMPQQAIEGPVREHFLRLAVAGIAVCVLLALAAAWLLRRGSGRLVAGTAGFAAVFVAMSLAVVASMVDLYADGAQAKTRALAASLAERLEPIVTFGLDIKDFDGLDRTFASYRALNPDISAIALLDGERAAIHTDPTALGAPWKAPRHAYQYIVPLGEEHGSELRVAVTLPSDVVWAQVLRAAKDFAALFIAAIVLATLFLQLGGTLHSAASNAEHAIDLVRPAFLLAVLAENLIVSFLPQHMHAVAIHAANPATAASLMFMAYFIAFALSLPLAAAAAGRHGPRPVIAGGALLAALGFLPLLFTTDPALTALGRGLSGLGQGLLLAGTQTLVLAYAAPGRRTQGTAIIVYGFNAGMIAGAALGSLLAGLLGTQAVLWLASGLALAVAAYAGATLPAAPPAGIGHPTLGGLVAGIARDVSHTMRDGAFLRVLLLVGGPAKAVLTGVIAFGLPLLLSRKGYPASDIGQIVMLYALGVLASGGRAARLVDRLGRSDGPLLLGAAASGLGLALIGAVDWPPIATGIGAAEPFVIAAAVFVIGLAHGFVNAPVVTNVADLPLAKRMGPGAVAANYRLLERLGHITGPLIVGQLLILGMPLPPMALIGLVLAAFGILFFVLRPRTVAPAPED
jgi:MFS family permease